MTIVEFEITDVVNLILLLCRLIMAAAEAAVEYQSENFSKEKDQDLYDLKQSENHATGDPEKPEEAKDQENVTNGQKKDEWVWSSLSSFSKIFFFHLPWFQRWWKDGREISIV